MTIFDQGLRNFLTDQMMVIRVSSQDIYGTKTGTPEGPFRCRIIGKDMKVVQDTTGQEQVSHLHAIFDTDHGFRIKDEFTSEARFPGFVFIAIAVNYATDENGASHQRVYF
jgi:hypothetical protein